MASSRTQLCARLGLALGAALTVLFGLHAVTHGGGEALNQFFTRYVYNAVLALAVAVIAVRGMTVRRERWAWLALAGGLLSWGVANTYYSVFLDGLDPVPIPSVADGLWLAFYPAVYGAVLLLARSRLAGIRRGLWLDGVIAALAAAAVCAALVVQIMIGGGLEGSPIAVATTLAYPLGDLILVGATMLVGALNGWRLDRTWQLLGSGFLLFAAADAAYFWYIAEGTYVGGRVVDVGWLVAALLFAAAASHATPPQRETAIDGRRLLVLPAGFGLLGLGLVVAGNVTPINRLALVLATLSVVAVIARMSLTFAESRREALSDPLTGLPNRRRLTRDLRDCVGAARPERPLGLVIFDLNGFKGYNDRFGHPAGDALLVRLSRRLQAALDDEGQAYRMGGDEFCALLTPRRRTLEQLVEVALLALAERGDGFGIDAAHGFVGLPVDARDSESALRLGDERMYTSKHSLGLRPEHRTGDALAQILVEHRPGDHARGVDELASATGLRLGLRDDELADLALAARLHDIGKAAVPDEVLAKPGPLDPHEWDMMRRHAAIGERIMGAAPGLAGVARIIRSSHERWDGAGYPDRLQAHAIPVCARVIAVCDAFDAIIRERPYVRRRTPTEAAIELRRCAGTQFDPAVVDAFLAVLDARAAHPLAGVASTEAATVGHAPGADQPEEPARSLGASADC